MTFKFPSFHVSNAFKKKPATSAASMAKFLGPTPGTPATQAPPPKASRWSAKKSAQAFFSHFFKSPASTKASVAPVAQAQQGVIQALTTNQPLVADHRYQAYLQVLAQDYATTLNAPEPAFQEPVTPPPTLQAPTDDTSTTGPDPLQQQVAALLARPMESLESALSRREAEVQQGLAQLMADMAKTGETFRSVKLPDGSTVSASFNKDKSVFTVQDSTAYHSSGEFGAWVSVHVQHGSLRLNNVAPAEHVSPGPALRDALLNIELLLAPAPATV